MTWLANYFQCEGNVFKHCLTRKQFVVLKHIAHVATQEWHTRVGQIIDVLTGNPDITALRSFLAVNESQNGRLA